MTPREQLTTPSIYSTSLGKRMLLGAGIGFILIALFLISAGDPKPEWPRLWMIRPLIIVPFSGAMGGLFYHFMDILRYRGGWGKIMVNIISLIVFLIGLWLGIVLGLVGTYWD